MKFEKQLLTKRESEYLGNAIKMFEDRGGVNYICKAPCLYGVSDKELIHIGYGDEEFEFSLPHFKKGSSYKKLEINKKYTLEELGLNA